MATKVFRKEKPFSCIHERVATNGISVRVIENRLGRNVYTIDLLDAERGGCQTLRPFTARDRDRAITLADEFIDRANAGVSFWEL